MNSGGGWPRKAAYENKSLSLPIYCQARNRFASSERAPVATTHGIIDILVLLPGKSAAELRSQLNRLRERYPEVFEKELDRIRKRNEDKDPNWIPVLTVRFRDNIGRVGANATPVATIHGIIDILVLLPGKSSAELRSKIINVFVRFVGGGLE